MARLYARQTRPGSHWGRIGLNGRGGAVVTFWNSAHGSTYTSRRSWISLFRVGM